MRMKELVEQSGLPRTTIHYYLRIGLLHAPEKAAVNSAIYDQSHLDRLALVTRLRAEDGENLPVFHVQRVLDLVDDGVAVDRAVALQRAVLDTGTAGKRRSVSGRRMAASAKLSERRIADLERRGLLKKAPGSTEFDHDDLELARAVRDFLEVGVDLGELEWIVARIREVSAFEMAIAVRLIENAPAARRAQILLELQKSVNVLHQYAFLRSRQSEVQEMHESERNES
mgnify:CR=1 FL=1